MSGFVQETPRHADRQMVPLAKRCPPKLYGETERIVSRRDGTLGHDVTLFAKCDSSGSREGAVGLAYS
jgi:hypothetical protein